MEFWLEELERHPAEDLYVWDWLGDFLSMAAAPSAYALSLHEMKKGEFFPALLSALFSKIRRGDDVPVGKKEAKKLLLQLSKYEGYMGIVSDT
jgi:hypothetical protein